MHYYFANQMKSQAKFATEDEVQLVFVPDSEIFRQKYKWIFMFLLCFSQIGMLYNSQAIPTLQVPFEKELGIDEITYSQLLIADAVPNLIFPIIGGYFTDYFGGPISFIVTSLVIVLGQCISTFAAYDRNLIIFIIGKIVLGIGASTSALAKTKLVKLWFENHEIGKAVSSIVLIDTAAIIISDLVYPGLYEYSHNLGFPFLMGAFLCFVSLIFGICLIMLHHRFTNLGDPEAKEEEANKQISIKDIRNFPKIFWLLLFTMIWTLVSFSLVKIYQSKFLQVTFSYTISEASFFLAASQAVTALTTPAAGILIERYGNLTKVMIIGNILIQLGTLLIITIPSCSACLWPTIPIMCQSVGLGLALLSFYSSLVRIIDQKQLGLAMANFPVIMSLHMIIFPGFAGYIANNTFNDYGYNFVFVLSLSVGICGLGAALKTHFQDNITDKKLQTPKIVAFEMQLQKSDTTTATDI